MSLKASFPYLAWGVHLTRLEDAEALRHNDWLTKMAVALWRRPDDLKEIALPTIRLLVLIPLLAVPALTIHAAAQSHLPYKMPSEVGEGMSSAAAYTPAFAPVVSLPQAPAPQRVIDKKFIAVMSALGGAESLRLTSRKLVLENEFAAGAPWVTSVPRTQNEVVKNGSIFAAEFVVAYELKKRHSWLPGDRVIRKLWWAYPAAMVAIHTKNGIGNIRTQGPGGCTSIQCAEQMQ